MVSGNVINIYTSRTLHYVIENLSKWIMHVIPKPCSILEGCIHYKLLYFRSFLIVDQTEVEGIFSHFGQDIEWMGESISNRDAF